MLLWRKTLAYSAVLLFLIGFSILVASCFSHSVRSIDSPVQGLIDPINGKKTVHLVIVHGIGGHCIGYSDDLVAGLANNLDLRVKSKSVVNHADWCPAATDLEPGENVAAPQTLLHKQQEYCAELYKDHKSCQEIKFDATLGFIRTSDYYSNASDDRAQLRVYEVVWDPTTRWAKETYVQYLDHLDDEQRTLFNRRGKWKLINDAITDAVLYLGGYKTQMQFAVFMGFCKIMSDGTVTDFSNLFVCTPQNVSERFAEKNHIAVISHSLGTRMVFDTLAHMGDPDGLLQTIKRLNIPVPEISRDTLENVTEAFRHGVGSVFAFANQIPLLEMGLITKRDDFVNIRALNNPPPPPVDLGTGFQMFLDERIKDIQVAELQPASAIVPVKPLQVVAFTDHDDFLSFNLKCWYYLNVIKFDENIIARRKHYIDNGATIPRELQFKRCEAGGKKEFWDIVGNKISMSNVIVRLGFHVPWIFSNPIGAHSNYWVDGEVHRLIACGAAQHHSGNIGAAQVKTCKR